MLAGEVEAALYQGFCAKVPTARESFEAGRLFLPHQRRGPGVLRQQLGFHC
jgi:hypothetical protein